jgi:hypothetical protein
MAGWVLGFSFGFFEMHKPIHNVLSSKEMPSVHERLFKALWNFNKVVLTIDNLMHKFFFYNKSIILLYMFRALLCSSSGGQIVLI